MKSTVKLLSLIVLSSLFLTNCMLDDCSTKKSYLKKFYAFIDDVSDNHEDYDEDDWKVKDEKLKKYIEECYEKHESDLTESERKEIWAKTLKYYFKRYGYNLKKFIEGDGKEISERFKNEIKKLEDSAEDFERIFKEVFEDDLSELIDSAVDLFEEFGNKLKEELESEN